MGYLKITKHKGVIIMAQYIGDICVSDGEYTDQQGQLKKRWQKVGAAFKNEYGKISFKLDYMPMSNDFSGWFNIFEKDQQNTMQQNPAPVSFGQPSTGFNQQAPVQPQAMNPTQFQPGQI
jgi:hypothetical protein